jgi:hypothetical protein
MKRARTDTFEHTISGLLTKRADLFQEGANIRARLAEIRNDIDAVDRTLGILGYKGDLDAAMPRARREVTFGRGELTRGVLEALRDAKRPLTSRDIAQQIGELQGRDASDRRYVTELTRRVSKALRLQKEAGRVRHGTDERGNLTWLKRSI